jgi:hypothetical protein
MGLASEEHVRTIKGAKVHRALVIRAQQFQQCETVLGEVLQWSGDRSPFQLLRKAVLGELLHAPAAKTDIWQHSSR